MRGPRDTRTHTVIGMKKQEGERCIIFGMPGGMPLCSVPVTMAKRDKWLIEIDTLTRSKPKEKRVRAHKARTKVLPLRAIN